ncbi:hypothetical protein [Aneurinibacillus migulanus]|uniref:Uncharacterized protein n=1 Tax=Aneurinibacillus migulanus TaxID=47500 RepID=A0A1G8NLK9_ANEMI|nr:hypothetical protein [Aneurinibacillus migulanus]SDI81149.1 hypothetical protein SAMN04487909_10825 [Aneurinibacillus migulanus]
MIDKKVYVTKGVDYPVSSRVDSHHTVPQTGVGSSPARKRRGLLFVWPETIDQEGRRKALFVSRCGGFFLSEQSTGFIYYIVKHGGVS